MALTEVEDKGVILRLFEDIQTALQSLIDNETIRSVEIFNAQTDFEGQERPRRYPFIAVQFTVEWEKPKIRSSDNENNVISQMEQLGMCNVTIYHVFSQLETETIAFEKSEAIRHLVHRALNELQDSNYYTHLLRINTLDDSSHDRVFNLMTVYQCQVMEPAYNDQTGKTATVSQDITTNLDVDSEIIRSGDGEI